MLTYFRFHHVGVATRSIEQTAAIYAGAGYAATVPVADPLQDVRICFLTKENMPTIELLEPVDDRSPVNDILRKNGTAPYHFCYAVPDIEQAVRELKSQKYVLIRKPAHAVAFDMLGGGSMFPLSQACWSDRTSGAAGTE